MNDAIEQSSGIYERCDMEKSGAQKKLKEKEN